MQFNPLVVKNFIGPDILGSYPKYFNREEISELTLELLALDSGTPRLTGTGTLRVIVEDVNDNQPAFENDVYFLSTEENVDVGTSVLQLKVDDKDSGSNFDLTNAIADAS